MPDIPVHVTQRGLNRNAVFAEEEDHLAFLENLVKAKIVHGCKVHAYVLMTNHYHLLVTPPDGRSLSAMMQTIGRHFVPYMNRKYGGSGTIWEGCFKASLVQSEHYFLNCMRYIEMNPVVAQMVETPVNYRWSSYLHNTQGEEPFWLDEHEEYLNLGNTSANRQQIEGLLNKKVGYSRRGRPWKKH